MSFDFNLKKSTGLFKHIYTKNEVCKTRFIIMYQKEN